MKKLGLIVVMGLLMVASVIAAGDDLDPKTTNIGHTDIKYVNYCVTDISAPSYPVLVTISVDNVCKDKDSFEGCGAGDDFAQTVFTATPMGDIVLGSQADYQCTQIELETVNALGGTFYYTVNGEVNAVKVVDETGRALIPEFTTLGAGLVLLGAGLFAYKKRK